MLSARENKLNFYARKPMDQFTTYFQDLEFSWQCSGFHERPPHLTSGYDWFGVYWEYDPAQQAFVPDHRLKPILDDICDWREVVKWPDLDAMNWEEAARIDEVDKKDKVNKAYGVLLGMGPFERMHTLMGFENCLIALVTEPEESKAFIQKWTEWKCKLLHYISVFYKPDFIQFQDDSGTQNSSFYSPETWRDIFKPAWTACCAEIKKHGIYAELHSCGKGQKFFEEIEDCGFDSMFIQPINDYNYLLNKWAGRIGIVNSGLTNELEAVGGAGGITVKEVRDHIFKTTKNYIENSPTGSDYMPLAMPFPVTPGMNDDTIVTTQFEIGGIAFEALMMHSAEFTKMMQDRQKANTK